MNNPDNLRVIKTARSKEAINQAVKEGFWPLVKPVIPSPEIKSKFAVIQSKTSGEIEVVADYRLEGSTGLENAEKVIDFTYYYPYHFENPFAAYLIPSDLNVGEKVWIEDLIEDVVGSSWNQGDTYRLNSVWAVWDGTGFSLTKEINLHSKAIIG